MYSPERIEKSLVYVGFAIMLNSLTGLDDGEFNQVQQWAQGVPFRWQALFFASGLLLSHDESIRWEQMANVIRGASGVHRPVLEETFDIFNKER